MTIKYRAGEDKCSMQSIIPDSRLMECSVLANTPDKVMTKAIENFRSELLKGGPDAWEVLMGYDECTTRQYLLGSGSSVLQYYSTQLTFFKRQIRTTSKATRTL